MQTSMYRVKVNISEIWNSMSKDSKSSISPHQTLKNVYQIQHERAGELENKWEVQVVVKKHSRLRRREREKISNLRNLSKKKKLFQMENFTYLFTSLRSCERVQDRKELKFPSFALVFRGKFHRFSFNSVRLILCVCVWGDDVKKLHTMEPIRITGNLHNWAGEQSSSLVIQPPLLARANERSSRRERERNFLFEYFVLLLSPATFSCLKQRNNFPSNDHNINFHFVT